MEWVEERRLHVCGSNSTAVLITVKSEEGNTGSQAWKALYEQAQVMNNYSQTGTFPSLIWLVILQHFEMDLLKLLWAAADIPIII